MAQNHVAKLCIPKLSRHAALRRRQRGLRDIAIDYVLDHGAYFRRTGVTFVVLRWCDVPVTDRRTDRWVRLVGTVVIVGTDERIVTTYRNRRALRDIRRKSKYSHERRRHGFRAGE